MNTEQLYESNETVTLHKGSIKRRNIWLAIRLSIYTLTFVSVYNIFAPRTIYVSSQIQTPWQTKPKNTYINQVEGSYIEQFFAISFSLIVLHFILNAIYKNKVFLWIFKTPYSKLNDAYFKRAVK